MKHEYDTEGFYDVLKEFPDQFPHALELAEGVMVHTHPKRILISGMGGSALPGDILGSYLRGETHIYMNRDYGVPHWVDDTTLVICISYSGNTEETLESYRDARDRGANIVVITAGGELLELAKEHDIPTVLITDGLQPRCATGYIFTSIIAVLMNSSIVGEHHRKEIIGMAEELKTLDFVSEAEAVAKELKNHIPIIYASDRFHSLARVWKIKINENAKVQAFHNSFPELNHNEMVGFTNLVMKPYLIFLKSPLDHERVQKRMTVTKEILTKKGIPVHEVMMKGNSLITEIFSTLLLGDWISYYLSREYKTDPMPVQLVEDFKNTLRD